VRISSSSSISGDSGMLELVTGTGVEGKSGSFFVVVGTGQSGIGGDVVLKAGEGAFGGGSINVAAGSGTDSSSPRGRGGSVSMYAGLGAGDDGGSLYLFSGESLVGSTGEVLLQSATSFIGGSGTVTVTSGTTSSGQSGDVLFRTGNSESAAGHMSFIVGHSNSGNGVLFPFLVVQVRLSEERLSLGVAEGILEVGLCLRAPLPRFQVEMFHSFQELLQLETVDL